jgi:hypothetical protein
LENFNKTVGVDSGVLKFGVALLANSKLHVRFKKSLMVLLTMNVAEFGLNFLNHSPPSQNLFLNPL